MERQGNGWLLQDAGSTNGTFVDQQRVRQVAITGNCSVRLGHPEDGPLLSCSVTGSPDGPAAAEPVRVQAATAIWQPGGPGDGNPAAQLLAAGIALPAALPAVVPQRRPAARTGARARC